ncbi:alanine--tRNA ligase [Mucilaginibacter sp. RS28]|uniref:Alanine--tRNA ligase n=1 Tax=Mucilaginibacter straminoryzae TaxID=2932774 RepID=A0A9X1X585_9SPHI|nr:alanine--tRNA ligase [Mucilaginibacter straminoryzae]MCJ8211211.1 alanine--tRNA ligase [Mucilaginibacter straminoryzae]
MTAQEIRQAFLDFFASKGHTIVPSAPIVVKNDPTLMFTNAGMNQFKDIFLGEAPAKFPRVADTQRCLRVSGKHNDLEEVGIDTYHHTMFEMLGNWSFGDYFKKEAIEWSWELLTEVYKLPKDRLYVTYFQGDEKEGLERDQEAYDLWKQFVAEDHILPGNKKDNFWEMGETGPCGPCSEIHFDGRTDEERVAVSGAQLVNADDPNVIEIWNNVFMQFNRLKDGSLQSLPAKHVDTGMGFERLVRVLQNKTSNYDTDVFMPLINFIAGKSGKVYDKEALPSGEGLGGASSSAWNEAVAMRVMADHIRAISFAIADGQLPSNNKAGYVIRRILRRAVRYQYQYLGFKEPFLNQLVPLLAEQFKGVFDELWNQKDFVQKVVLEEEVSFLRTLGLGIRKINDYILVKKTFESSPIQVLTDSSTNIISGPLAFELQDTYGFPIDLTELIAREAGLKVDMQGFEAELQKQKDRSRAATAIDTGDWILLQEEDNVEFTGYDELETVAHVVKYRKVKAKGKEQYQIVLDKTPFYAESGGQVGDTGELIFLDGSIIKVTDTKKENGLIVHFADELPENVSDVLTAYVDPERRQSTNRNHSATHLLHAAMKQVLGSHVNQKGSLVNSDYLRFDFSHFAKVTEEEIQQIEQIVNAKIRENIFLKEERNVPYQEALASGVTALFGEKYGDFVRVITFDDNYSKELCGGTHVKATGQIGFFKITSESAVAAGVRRIEAITGIIAENYISDQSKLIQQLKELLKNPKDVAKSVESLLEENNKLKKDIERSILEKAAGLKTELAAKAKAVNGINFLADKVALPNAEAVKTLAYQLKDIVPNLFLVLAADFDGKPNLTVMIADNLVKEKGLNAGNIVRELAKEIQGGGGGQPFFATAGGKDITGLDKALQKAESYIA